MPKKSYRVVLSPSFSALVLTNVLLHSLDDLSICDEVHPLPLRQMPHIALCGPRAVFVGCAELLSVEGMGIRGALHAASSLQHVSIWSL